MFKGGLNARLNALGVAPPKMEKGPKSAPKFFSDSFQFLAELRVLQPPLCIKKPLCEAVLRVLAGSCTQNSTPFHIFSFFMKTHKQGYVQGIHMLTALGLLLLEAWIYLRIQKNKTHNYSSYNCQLNILSSRIC